MDTIQEEPKDSSLINKKKKKRKGPTEEEIQRTTLPIVDSYEQNKWRRKIFFDKIKKS